MGFNSTFKGLREKLNGSHARSERFGKEIYLLPLSVLELRTVQPVAVTIFTELSRPQIEFNIINMNAILPIKLSEENCPENAVGMGQDHGLDGTVFESRLEQRNFLQKPPVDLYGPQSLLSSGRRNNFCGGKSAGA